MIKLVFKDGTYKSCIYFKKTASHDQYGTEEIDVITEDQEEYRYTEQVNAGARYGCTSLFWCDDRILYKTYTFYKREIRGDTYVWIAQNNVERIEMDMTDA